MKAGFHIVYMQEQVALSLFHAIGAHLFRLNAWRFILELAAEEQAVKNLKGVPSRSYSSCSVLHDLQFFPHQSSF